MFSLRRWLLFALKVGLPCVAMFCLLLVLLVVIEVTVKLPLTAQEALLPFELMTPKPPPANGYFQILDNQPMSYGRVIFTIHDMPTSTSDCFMIDFVLKRPFTGVNGQGTTGGCSNRNVPFLVERGPLDWSVWNQDGAQAIGGFVGAGVAQVRALRADGTQATYPVTSIPITTHAGTFFFVHPATLPPVVSLEALDAQGQAVPDGLTYLPVPPLILATREVDLGAAGVIRMEAYTETARLPVTQPQDCVKLIFATRANLRNMLTGNTYSTQTIACAESAAGLPFGAQMGTDVENLTLTGGRAWWPDIAQVQIHWSDGFNQTTPVVDTFFFFQRPQTNAAPLFFLGFDAAGQLIAQQP